MAGVSPSGISSYEKHEAIALLICGKNLGESIQIRISINLCFFFQIGTWMCVVGYVFHPPSIQKWSKRATNGAFGYAVG